MKLVQLENPSSSIALITFNDPKNLNAMSEEMAGEFSTLVGELSKNNGLRAIVLTGAGRAFSAGGDLAMLERKTRLPGEENRRLMLNFYDSFLGILKLNIPLIAAINGAAVGAGLCVASACDIRISAKSVKLGFTFVKLGLHPGMGATYFLPRILGFSSAAELMLTGRMIEADEALRIGLVSKVVDDDKIRDEALAIAQEISQVGAEASRQLLESLRGGNTSLMQALEREALCQSINYASAEFKEGVSAVKEKRRPQFT